MGVYGDRVAETPEQTTAKIREILATLKSVELKSGQLDERQDSLAEDIAHEALGVLARRSQDNSMVALSAVARLAARVICGPRDDMESAESGKTLLDVLLQGHVVTVLAEQHVESVEEQAAAEKPHGF